VEETFKEFASKIALAMEVVAVLLIVYGGASALVRLLILRTGTGPPFHNRRRVFIEFGAWLILGLEFELAADIIRSAISPTWKDIGQLAAIAVIRTFLNYFLERDVEEFAEPILGPSNDESERRLSKT
jgi:uncharacterized membrane protein